MNGTVSSHSLSNAGGHTGPPPTSRSGATARSSTGGTATEAPIVASAPADRRPDASSLAATRIAKNSTANRCRKNRTMLHDAAIAARKPNGRSRRDAHRAAASRAAPRPIEKFSKPSRNNPL